MRWFISSRVDPSGIGCRRLDECPLLGEEQKTFAKRRETGKKERVQVSYDEGGAIHIGPESCAVAREGFGQALTGERIGQPLSRERVLLWGPTPRIWREATYPCAPSRAPARPRVLRDPGICS